MLLYIIGKLEKIDEELRERELKAEWETTRFHAYESDLSISVKEITQEKVKELSKEEVELWVLPAVRAMRTGRRFIAQQKPVEQRGKSRK